MVDIRTIRFAGFDEAIGMAWDVGIVYFQVHRGVPDEDSARPSAFD